MCVIHTRLFNEKQLTLISNAKSNVGDNYVIESSQDLIEWTERLTGTVPDGETEVVFTDEEATPDLPKRYYRVRQS